MCAQARSSARKHACFADIEGTRVVSSRDERVKNARGVGALQVGSDDDGYAVRLKLKYYLNYLETHAPKV